MRKHVTAGAAAMLIGLAISGGAAQAATNTTNNNTNTNTNTYEEHNPSLDEKVKAQVDYCQQHFNSCAQATKNAAGILVFPNVLKADLIVGGAGGKGALIENGKITGYYYIGAGSVGLQAGFQDATQVYVFPSKQSLKVLKEGSFWRVGDTEGVTVMAADANARSATGNVEAFIFDSRGLHAGISADLFDIWKSGTTRPQNVG